MRLKQKFLGLAGSVALAASLTPGTAMAWADWHEASLELVFGCCYNQFSNQVDRDSGFSRSERDSAGETCVFRHIAATDSGAMLPPVPGQCCHPFRTNAATP